MSFINVFNNVMSQGKPIEPISLNKVAYGIDSNHYQPYTPAAQKQNNGEVPTFGIKAKQPLNSDTFEKGEKQQLFSYKGQKLSKKDAQEKSYSDVYRHESAHLAKAGGYATTGIVIDYDENHIAKGGHVGIAMPKLDKKNPKKTVEHAETVIAAAEAPASFDELSNADIQVAAQARAIKSQALNLLG